MCNISIERKGVIPTCPSASGNEMKAVRNEILHKGSLLARLGLSPPNFHSGPNLADFSYDVKLLCVL